MKKNIYITFIILATLLAFGLFAGKIQAQNASESSDTIRQKVEEKVNQALKNPKAYIGTITDISESTIQINKFVFDKDTEKSGEILQISTAEDTAFVNTTTTAKEIKRADLAIGDFIVAMGYKNGNSVLNAKRVLVTDTQVNASRMSEMANVETVSKSEIEVSPFPNGEIQTIKSAKTLKVTYEKNQKIQNGAFSDISEGDKIVVVGNSGNGTFEARSIHILPGPATEKSDVMEASPTPKASSKP